MPKPWYEESELKEYIENLILASYLYKKDYDKAENPGKAQLWIVSALLAKKIEDLKEKIEKIEKIIKQKEKKQKEKKEPKQKKIKKR